MRRDLLRLLNIHAHTLTNLLSAYFDKVIMLNNGAQSLKSTGQYVFNGVKVTVFWSVGLIGKCTQDW